jgi:hypothetical protein
MATLVVAAMPHRRILLPFSVHPLPIPQDLVIDHP